MAPLRNMDLNEKKAQLQAIYEQFESLAAPYRGNALCKAGCAFCCSHAGAIDITTLEGMIVYDRIVQMPKPLRKQVQKQVLRNQKAQEKGRVTACPFLRANHTCMIYENRPFTCRRIYSVEMCDGKGPTLHRQVMAAADKTLLSIQRMDHTGYSGHISYILYMLGIDAFRDTYLKGEFNPGAVMAFGKAHKIIINQYITGQS